MKIAQIELFQVPPRWLFLKITTDSGIVGWGEPVLEGKAATVAACVKELEELLIGKDPSKIEDIWQMIYRGGFYRGGPIIMSALSGVDQALWDIKGKVLNVPVHQLLGGPVRSKMKMYCWIGGDDPSVVLEQAHDRVAKGYRAVKMNATGAMDWVSSLKDVKKVSHNIKILREEFGNGLDIGLDFHGRIHKPMVKKLIDELDPFDPMFIEEPVLPENNEALRHIYQYTSIPIATGERMFSRWDFKEILHEGVVDIIQPDLSHAGGISEVRRIAAMAEAYDIALATHCPLGPIALASALQVDFVSSNAIIQESSLDIHYNKDFDLLDYVINKKDFELVDGHIQLFEKPGLGVEIDEERLKEAAKISHSWKNPLWRTEDGNLAEW